MSPEATSTTIDTDTSGSGDTGDCDCTPKCLWNRVLLPPTWDACCCHNGRRQELPSNAIAQIHTLSQGVPATDIIELDQDAATWQADLEALLKAGADARVLLMWKGRLQLHSDGAGGRLLILDAHYKNGDYLYFEVPVPKDIDFWMVTGMGDLWWWGRSENGGNPTWGGGGQLTLDEALDVARYQMRAACKAKEAGQSGGGQILPDDVQLVGTPNGNWDTRPFAMAIKHTSGSPVLGGFVTYVASVNDPGPVSGFEPGHEYWQWNTTAWPDQFKLSTAGGNANADNTNNTWFEHTEGQVNVAPTNPAAGGVWYAIRSGGPLIIGYLWIDQRPTPTAMRWYGRTSALTTGRFQQQVGFSFRKVSGGPASWVGFQMFTAVI